jgi:hypothetical protein
MRGARAVFWLYLVVIVVGVAYAVTLGLMGR